MEYYCHLQRRQNWRPVYPNGSAFHKNKIVANGHLTPASNIVKLHHPVRELARTFDIVPALANQSLLSGNNFAKAGYISICNKEEVSIYDSRTFNIVVSEAVVLKLWCCPWTRLWQVPLQSQVTKINALTLLFNGTTGTDSLNLL